MENTRPIAGVGGIDSLNISKPSITNTAQAISPTSITPPKFSATLLSRQSLLSFNLIDNQKLQKNYRFNFGGADVISSQGLDSLTLGNHYIKNTAISIYTLGIASYNFGKILFGSITKFDLIDNNTLNNGVTHFHFGNSVIYTQGLDNLLVSNHTIRILGISIKPDTIQDTSFGNPIISSQKFINLELIEKETKYNHYRFNFGGADIVTAKGFGNEFFNAPIIKNKAIGIYPTGIFDSVIGKSICYVHTNRENYQIGKTIFDFTYINTISNTQSLRFDFNWNKQIITIGIDNLETGDLLVKYGNVKHIGIDLSTIGNHAVSFKNNIINHTGIESLIFTNPSIYFMMDTVTTGNIFSEKFGNTNIFHRELTIICTGIESSQFGIKWISHYIRNINSYGQINSSIGDIWISHSPRYLLPHSINIHTESDHHIGQHQSIQVTGVDTLAFGERIIPEQQAIYIQGFDSNHHHIDDGLTWISQHTRRLYLVGFLTANEQQNERFNPAIIYNSRQYIEQYYIVNSDLNEQPFGHWTSIENRNKVIQQFGHHSSKIGHHTIENKAIALLALDIDSQCFGNAMIADRIRHIYPEIIETPYISTWGVVWNSAKVITQKSHDTTLWGQAEIKNTRRYYRWIGNIDSLSFGETLIADRIRYLDIERRYSIEPPSIPLPKIELYTRYIEPVGQVYTLYSAPNFHIHWNIIQPKWYQKYDSFGEARLHNVTPELYCYGHNSEEFGLTFIRHQFRNYDLDGFNAELYGNTVIADRTRHVSLNSFNQSYISQLHKITRTEAPPYTTQYIYLNETDALSPYPRNQEGTYGIEPPDSQVSWAYLNQNVLYTYGLIGESCGTPHIQSNGILVHPGLQELTIGQHYVYLKHRTISLLNKGIDSTAVLGKPRLSPHTIYALVEAPEQAQRNHPSDTLHYINEYHYHVGEIFGTIHVQHANNILMPYGIYLDSSNIIHSIELFIRYIQPKGIQALRFGWHLLPHGEQHIIVYYDNKVTDLTEYGTPTIQQIKNQHLLSPEGIESFSIDYHLVEHYHRTIYPKGTDVLIMGDKKGGDNPFMWQGLRIGEHVPNIPTGLDMILFGTHWISNYVREIQAIGFDSFIMSYELSNFKQRMKVHKTKPMRPIQYINVNGIDNVLIVGIADIRNHVHYIRPDGNADQYRKGAF